MEGRRASLFATLRYLKKTKRAESRSIFQPTMYDPSNRVRSDMTYMYSAFPLATANLALCAWSVRGRGTLGEPVRACSASQPRRTSVHRDPGGRDPEATPRCYTL